ncbi:heparinase II/III-family protein [Chitinophaga horti]|uniref:Heparinase II/III-family protein n=1 Tax=Chitinophaga horti TaxID=2920382 RepID=A0ABY6J307_9BACT|nr:heparinase II/III-family protein [Chitinophaga horti]UYQ94054.1 heparinase II/III-family protein [Chitinophaga horti]
MKGRKHYLLLFVCLTAPLLLAAQITPRNLLQRYSPETVAASLIPRDKWKPFPNTPEAWKAQLPDSVLDQLVKAGEGWLKKDFKQIPASVAIEFTRNGNRSRYEALSFPKRKQLWDLMIAESIEGKGRFSNDIMNGVWSICEESFWGATAHLGGQKGGNGLANVEDPIVDLFAAETASMLAWTDYFAGAAMEKSSKFLRPRIYYEVNRRVLKPMMTAKYGYLGGGNPNAVLNNWAPWVMSNYLTASLLLDKEEKLRTDAIVRSMKVTDQYINGLGADGSCDEGPSYWFAAGACVFDVLNLMDDATGGKVNIYKEDIIQKMASYIYKTHIRDDYFINVADAPAKMKPDGLTLFRLGQAMDDEKMTAFGAWAYQRYGKAENKSGSGNQNRWHCMRYLYNLGAVKACTAATAAEPNVKDVWLADVQLMAARDGDKYYVATHGGHNAESHNHNDVGDFIVYAYGQPLIIDAGRGTYTAKTFSPNRYELWFNTSPYHNLPTINGIEQQAGRKFEATQVKYEGGKSPALNMHLESAYPKETGLKTWQRSVKLDRGKGIVIADTYSADAALKSLTQSFMTTCDIELAAGKVIFTLPDGKKAELSYDNNYWTAAQEDIALKTAEDEVFKTAWDGRPIRRILLTAKKPGAQGKFTYTIR